LKRKLFIILGCDTDPDRSYFVEGIGSRELSWRGMLEGIPRTKEKLAGMLDSDRKQPIFTWLLRADHQIRYYYGSYHHILSENKRFLVDLESDGDELGWHPHFWDFDENRQEWFQNFNSIEWQLAMIEEAYDAYQEILPGRGKSIRMGWTYHNDQTVRAINELGIKVDISAIPGMNIRHDSRRRRSANFYDWSITPRNPYYPSREDYRRPGGEDKGSYLLLMAPNFTSNSVFYGLLNGLVMAKKMLDARQLIRSLKRAAYMATITSKPLLFRPMLSQIRKDLRGKSRVFYITPFHPDELIPNIHPVYSLENMEVNIGSLLKLASEMDASVSYLRATEISNYIRD
jgi:hypothetical protein